MEILNSFDEQYSLKELLGKLEIINVANATTIVFSDLFDHKFDLCKPAEKSELNELASLFDYTIPDDYIDFLRTTNGLSMMDGVARLYDIEEVIDTKEDFHYPNNIMVVAQIVSDIHICIDLKANDNQYMYVAEPVAHNKAYCLNCDFKQFLLRFITSYGAPFWMWGADWQRFISIEEECDSECVLVAEHKFDFVCHR